jgi:hypothetical protein
VTPTIDDKTTRAELGAIVCQLLGQLGDWPVLVGGSVVSIYTNDRYVSDDLDMATWRRESEYAPLLRAHGFTKKGSWWEHPNTAYFVQFVNPPVMVGRKHIRSSALDRIATRYGELSILSPLDCTLDRLAWHLDRGDAETLEQAAAVAFAHAVSLDEVRAWLEGEGWPAPLKANALRRLTERIAALRR